MSAQASSFPALARLLATLLVLPAAQAASLASAPVRADAGATLLAADGVVEAVRYSVIAAQVAGVVSELAVKAGDSVRQGQLLARIDARAAEQTAHASGAQSEAARAALAVARKDYERQQLLFQKQFISPAAMDRAEAQFKAAHAQAKAQLATAGAAHTQSGFYALSAPYAGVVAEVLVNPGEMALPGRSMVSLYDPAALRVSASLPQASVAQLATGQPVKLEFPTLPAAQRWQSASRITVLPTTDAGSQTVQVRLDLPAGLALRPGLFARAWLPMQDRATARLYVPSQSVFRRGEMQLVYVLNPQGKPQLRQVKAGSATPTETEILAGVRSGERLALDPIAAAQLR